MKNYYTILLLFLISISAFSQNERQVNGKAYFSKNNKWYFKEQGKEFQMNEKTLTVRLQPSNTTDFEKLKELGKKMGFKILRKNKLGFVDLAVSEGYGIFNIVSSLSSITLVQKVELNSYGEYQIFNPNDDEVDNQWYIDHVNLRDAWDFNTGGLCDRGNYRFRS